MQDNYGQHGWKEFHRNRKDILSEFDKILEQTENRPVQVAHGIGVEAYLRKWLSEFLPKKFGVTSGYIIPNLYNDSGTIYHYDIIIYNRLDSPVLWTEGNEDQNEQGKFRAIPAKHIVAVYEVKSRLTKSNISESLKKLNQTESFANQFNPVYTCGIIFIDLKNDDLNKKSIIKELIKGKDIYGFRGGMVLRFEGDKTCTGKIDLFSRKEKKEPSNVKLIPLAKPMDELNIYSTEEGNITVAEQGGGMKLVKTGDNEWSVSKSYSVMYEENDFSIHLSWSRTHFADFCINLLSYLEGLAYNDENRPSFGQIFDFIEKKKAPLQSEKMEKGKPYLNLKIYDGKEHDKKLIVSEESSTLKITIPISAENPGEFDVIMSDDSFKNKLNLPKGKYAIKEFTYELKLKDDEKPTIQKLEKEKIRIPYRLVYYVDNTEKEFYAIEKDIIFKDGQIKLE
ncbi:DUF6602 domain-containing protein [Tenacibaculum piscium]|uniref:DUF6602 domain-containing protein n=1 Tax=Tenacibaculum piscium TaxID=1458515 RepID=A0A2H1YGS0_9FLAO|nr:DUF6602 domain-containing protein [Tenacibaculum piscium]MBE7630470.1 hypothetical protein [Tenacibaculum piscium]MBE7671654.1 hypothetical protein [Tenacibaculum piscium]SOS74571.1 conserved hypothetical protein [Tenacibaculum piscium]